MYFEFTGTTAAEDAARNQKNFAQFAREHHSVHAGDRTDEFSIDSCEVCGSHLSGERHAITVLDMVDGVLESEEYSGCTDCLIEASGGDCTEF